MNYPTSRPLLAILGAALALAAQPASPDDWRQKWVYRAMMRTSISGQKAEQIIRAINPQKDEAEAIRAADRWLRIYVELSEWRGKTYEDAFQLVMRAVEAHPIYPPDGVLMADVTQLVDAVDELSQTMGRSVDRVWRAVDTLRDRDKLTAQRLETVRKLWEQMHSGRKSGHPANVIIMDDVGIDYVAGCSSHFPMAGQWKRIETRLHEIDLLRGLNVVEDVQVQRRKTAVGIAVEWSYSAEEILGVVNAADGDGELAVRAMKETWEGSCSSHHLQRAGVFARNARSKDVSLLSPDCSVKVSYPRYNGDLRWADTERALKEEVVDLPKPRGTISEAERKRRNKARKTAKQARRRNRGK